ncbi:unnamed protein product [Allacma fusca]|uniref:Uncharacterized protein n=1 Tax=Allacma fusca TaxID=39272 RepID=A0A8J2KIL6_9HEXA|nr:unnamed protein product [Allacma fusca]
MENWRHNQLETELEGHIDKSVWNSDVHHIGHDVDTIEHWKPPDSPVHSYVSGRSFEDPDTFIRSIPDHPTALLEKETCAEDVLKVWIEISKFIVEKMKDGYGVKIAGLGTFTYSQEIVEELDKDHKMAQTLRRVPLMILSEFMVRMFDLVSPLNESLCQVPTIPLSTTVIAERTKLPRKNVDGIISEVLQSFARAVVCNKNLEFPFPNIGKLQVSNGKVLFKFYANFCHQLDFYTGKSITNPDSNIVPGIMTPLKRHVPAPDFRSVFHLREVRSVHQHDLLNPVKKVHGTYIPTSNLYKFNNPTYTLVEDRSRLVQFNLSQLNGPLLNKRCTLSWIKGKRDYLKPSPEPWPEHRYHVVQSSVVIRPGSDTLSNFQSGSATAALRRSPSMSKTGSPRPSVGISEIKSSK